MKLERRLLIRRIHRIATVAMCFAAACVVISSWQADWKLQAESSSASQAPQTSAGQLTLFVSVKLEGEGPLPIFANGAYPRLRLTKLDTNTPYEMPLNNVAINVPLNLQATADNYKVSVEGLPAGYAVKSILYRADEPGVRMVDVRSQNLQISLRAIGASFAGSANMLGVVDLPVLVTLVRTATPQSGGIRVTGSSGGLIVMPKLPLPYASFKFFAADATISMSGNPPGTLYSDGTFEFTNVSPGLHRIILTSNMGANGVRQVAAADVWIRDRNVEGISLQTVPLLPDNFADVPALPPNAAASAPPPLSSLTVRVQDESTKQQIASGWLNLSGAGAPVQFYIGNSTPVVQIPNLLPGNYRLEADSYGYTSKTQIITVGYGETSVNIAIARSPK